MTNGTRRKHSRPAQLLIWLRTALAARYSGYGHERMAEFKTRLGGGLPTAGAAEDLILAACDDGYFEKFAVGLIASVGAVPDAPALHIHLLKPSKKTLAEAEKLRDQYKRLTYTVDHCVGNHRSNAAGIYYTAARFILAPLLLENGVKRLLILDVDSVMNTSPWPIIDRMPADTSAGLVFRHELRRAWQKILANAVLFRSDEVGLRFAGMFARAILMNVSRPQKYYVDQIIPYYLVERSGASRSRIKSLPATINSLDYADDAAFWTAKGINKHSKQFQSVQPVRE